MDGARKATESTGHGPTSPTWSWVRSRRGCEYSEGLLSPDLKGQKPHGSVVLVHPDGYDISCEVFFDVKPGTHQT